MEGSINLAVSMNTTLAALFHSVQFLVCNYSFKRVNGDLDEFEFVVWNQPTNEREFLFSAAFLGLT